MPPSHTSNRTTTTNNPSSYHRNPSSTLLDPSSSSAINTSTHPSSAMSSNSSYLANPKARQYSHLHSRLATLNAHLADLENLVRMTGVQAGDMRFLGGYVGGLFMGASKVLGEEGNGAKGDEEGNEKSEE